MPSTRALVLFGHPSVRQSRLNRRMAEAVAGVPGVKVRDLYELYPDLAIDVAAEQAELRAHELIVFQHPFYWYSVPAVFKEWFDLVLEHGFAYGSGGTALQGKRWLTAITAGGPEASYRPDSYNHFSVRQLLAPVEQTALLCGMRFLDPYVTYGAHDMREDGAGDASIPRAIAAYRAHVEALLDAR